MCGIVGYAGSEPCAEILLDGLARLEYRGYDSAGVALIHGDQAVIYRSEGKLGKLRQLIGEKKPPGVVGIGHTRWATHGRPCEENAHPHKVGRVTVVHNGIIENHAALRTELQSQGRHFSSETDTEIIAHLVDRELQETPEPLDATRLALHHVRGAYAIALLVDGRPQEIIAARHDAPLIVGLGNDAHFVASDIPAILPRTRNIVYLEDGELARVTATDLLIVDRDGASVTRPAQRITWDAVMAEKGGHKHFMLKEIYEQPRAVSDTLRGRLSPTDGDVFLEGIAFDPARIQRVVIVACGTSYHAALIGKFLIESLSRLPTEVDLASEFRYRDPLVSASDLVVAISQSGETADTLAALREAKRKGARQLAICNVVGSSIARDAESVLYTHAGPEIGVASTKAFTTQLIALILLALYLGRRRQTLTADAARELIADLLKLPEQISEVLDHSATIDVIARRYAGARDVLFLGRGVNYPIALEGALKLKEISYIHAEGYAAGEMKHGPIALIDEHLPVVVIAPQGSGYEKILSNLAEVRARRGKVIAVASRGDPGFGDLVDDIIQIPHVRPALQPLLTVLPLQLLAYRIADLRGTDIDQPRNLAKSVTVE